MPRGDSFLIGALQSLALALIGRALPVVGDPVPFIGDPVSLGRHPFTP